MSTLYFKLLISVALSSASAVPMSIHQTELIPRVVIRRTREGKALSRRHIVKGHRVSSVRVNCYVDAAVALQMSVVASVCESQSVTCMYACRVLPRVHPSSRFLCLLFGTSHKQLFTS